MFDNQNIPAAQKIQTPPKSITQWINEQINCKSFFKGRSWNGQKTHEERLTLPVHKRNANQNRLRFHLTPVKMAAIKRIQTTVNVQGCREKGNFTHCWWECKLLPPLWGNCMGAPQKN
jgi:hypothetical protein